MRKLILNSGDKFAKNELDPPEFLVALGPCTILVRESQDESMDALYAEALRMRQARKAKAARMDRRNGFW